MSLPLPINILSPAQMEKIGAASRLLILLQRFLSKGNKKEKHKKPLVTAADCVWKIQRLPRIAPNSKSPGETGLVL